MRGLCLSQCDMLAIILCGGSGTRLWPVSREAMPKPFMRIGSGPSLIQRTALRARSVGADTCIVVTNAEYTFKTIEEITALGTEAPSQLQLLLEPVGRNTAPAIAAACVLLQSQGRADEPLISLPADHLIQDEARFASVAAHAATLAASGQIALFGIQPTLPETGFGYIECTAVPVGDAAQTVRRFVEKPSPEKA